jgi:hypothetical protein
MKCLAHMLYQKAFEFTFYHVHQLYDQVLVNDRVLS